MTKSNVATHFRNSSYVALSSLAVIWIGWGSHREQSADVAKSLSTMADEAVISTERDVIELTLPAATAFGPATTVYLIGSLGDAGTLYPVTLEVLRPDGSAPPARESAPPIEATVERVHAVNRLSSSRVQPAPATTADLNRTLTPTSREVTPTTQQQRVFFVQSGANPLLVESYTPVTTRLAAESIGVRLWLDTATPCEIPTDDLSWLATSLEDNVLPRLNGLFGTIEDVDGDGKLAVCLTPRLADFPAAESAVEGLVQVNDFQLDLPRPFSNQADVMFLSASLRPGPHLQTVLAHEAAHLAVFSRRQAVDHGRWMLEDDWLNEGLAHYAEQLCDGDWSNIEHRLTAFASNSATSPLIVTDAGRQRLWRHPGARGAAWLFLAWLADEFGEDVIRQLAVHPGVGCEKLEEIVAQPFEELFRQWTIADWQSQPSAAERPLAEDIAALPAIQQVSFSAGPLAPTRLAAGLRRAGQMMALDLNANSERSEFVLRGTSVQACCWTASSGACSRLCISAPKACRLQVTLLEPTAAGHAVTRIR